ncbi:MAG: hypothetical protein D6705_16985 [Deltaproteobacteria bacterium]|nr:MAG: hypothetical protein D6705_16985 [Deltaproteobacteria bacterium]
MILWAEDADSVVPPMKLAASQMLPPCGAHDPIRYAWSPEADAGRITWSFEALDDLQADIYALVYDDLPGLQNLDPDSYWLSLDGGPEMRWAYGCYTASWPEARWGWVPLLPLVSGNCSADAPTYDVPAGVHTISLRNNEPEQQGRIASIAAIYIAPTPAPDPYEVYDPYP